MLLPLLLLLLLSLERFRMGLLQLMVMLENKLRTGTSKTKRLNLHKREFFAFVLDVPVRVLLSSIVDLVPCDR